jgi:hydrogenase maturation protease
MRVLVYGYGNPGRQDDGLGIEIVVLLEKEGLAGVSTDANYQLNIEDAAALAGIDAVIFVDASYTAAEPFEFGEIFPAEEIRFTTHSMSPQSVLALCDDMGIAPPQAFLLAIRGYEWEFCEGLSPGAASNRDAAFSFLKNLLLNPSTGSLKNACGMHQSAANL